MLDPPHRIVFTLSVEKYSSDVSTVTIAIAPLRRGCELTLTHENPAEQAAFRDSTQKGWSFVTSQSHLLALLRVAAARDEQTLGSMKARS